MRRDPVERITAAAVSTEILEEGEYYGFCGHCCGAEDESSDGTDGGGAWDDTVEVAVRPAQIRIHDGRQECQT